MKSRYLIIICIIPFFSFVIGGTFFLQQIVYSEPDSSWKVMFVCTTGLKPNGFSVYVQYDNGTHTIDMDSCDWIHNSNYKPASQEYQEIHEMSCSELIKRHATGRPYQNNENMIFAESKISNCNSVKDWSDAQKKVDMWR